MDFTLLTFAKVELKRTPWTKFAFGAYCIIFQTVKIKAP
jgi:hypothetical protein